MKRSLLSKAIGAGVISLNLVMLPIALPVSAQTNAAPSNSNTGSSNTAGDTTTGTSTTPNNSTSDTSTNTSDPNINPSTTPSDTTTGASTAPSNSTSDTSTTGNATTGNSATPSDTTTGSSTTPSDSTSGTSTTSGEATTGASTTPSDSTSGTSTTSGEATTGTAPNQAATATKSERADWGWLGLLGLLGLAGLFRKTPSSSAVGIHRNERLQTGIHSKGDRLEQGTAQAGAGLRNFWDELRTDVSDFKERRAQSKEIKQIKNALGRPSTRVILDRQDNIILNVGDLITHEAIERARVADMLDVLLTSVDEQQPAIADQDRVAPVPGEASLEEREKETTVNSHPQ